MPDFYYLSRQQSTLNAFPRLQIAKWSAFVIVASGSMVAFAFLPSSLLSGTAVLAAVAAGLFTLGLIVCVARAGSKEESTFRIAIYSWWFLIVSEQIFVRKGASDADFSGKFAAAAYGEVFTWVVVFCAICAVLLRNFPSSTILRTQYRWLLLFAGVATLSCAYSPSPLFALAWALKLIVSVLILLICRNGIVQQEGQQIFWKSLFWAYCVLVFVPLATSFTHPGTMFGWRGFDDSLPTEFRLNTNIHPVDLSEHAGIFVLVGLTLHALDRKRSRLVIVLIAAAVMILAFGKAAIVSCTLSTLLFFVVQRRLKAATVSLLGLAGLGLAAFVLTPIGSYFHDYGERESAATLTGRTELWELAMPEIMQHPILGHGFMASKFVEEALDTDWDAGQMHNAFLEVLYNNGIVGLALILAMNFCIVRNAWIVLRHARDHSQRVLASGSLALYAFLFLNGLVEPTFGGRPSCVFVVFEGLLVLTYGLRQTVLPGSLRTYSPALPELSLSEI